LQKFHEETQSEGLKVLWISKDKSAEDQMEYYKKSFPSSWLYVPFGKENQ